MPRFLTAFHGNTRIAHGAEADVALALHHHGAPDDSSGYLIFDDATGAATDLDLRGGTDAIVARYGAEPRSRGRPRLGVVAREVTLLPRHWDWLASQRGGASAALRRLIDAARHADEGDTSAQDRDAAYRFASAMAGNQPGFEAAMRALYAGDPAAMRQHMAQWPADIAAHIWQLARIAQPN